MIMPARFGRGLLPGILLTFAATLAVPAYADVVLYSTGFESPTFTAGAIAGQDGWAKFGPGLSSVSNSFAKTGSQSVFVDGGTASQSGPYLNVSGAGSLVDMSADIAIFTSSTQTEWQFAATGTGLNQFLGGINILPNGSIEVETPGFPIIGVFPRATAFDATAWHHIDLLFNVAAQTYDIALDGLTIDSNVPFCGSNVGCTGANVAAFGAGFFDSFGSPLAASGAPTGNDSGYMDNFRVANVSAAVPEPSSLLLFGTVLLGAVIVMKRKLVS